MHVMKVHSAIRDYSVCFAEDLGFLREVDERHPFVACDRRVWELYRGELAVGVDEKRLLLLDIGEERKSLAAVVDIYDALLARGVRRSSTLISVGGGITQDLTGFAASTLHRGIRWVYLPTTLLAQADSCIGGKTSLNHRSYKNLIGTFYPPAAVYIYPGFLPSLSRPDFFSGFGEVVKLHLLGGPTATQALLADLAALHRREAPAMLAAIRRSLEIKRSFFEEDEFDTGRRRLLNFGHCLGHALETTSAFEIPHGQAVMIGMIFANFVARSRELLGPEMLSFLHERVLGPNLVVAARPEHLEPSAIVEAMKMDKKREGEALPLIMMREGHEMVEAQDLRAEEVAAGLRELARFLESRR